MDQPKVLVLGCLANAALAECLRQRAEVVEAASIEDAIGLLRKDDFSAILADAGDFLPLERALVSQQATLILNNLGEGVCIVDGEGRCNWMNRRMAAWPPRVHERVRRACQEAFAFFSSQPPVPPDAPPRSRRYPLDIDGEQWMEMVCSPVVGPAGQVVQIAAVVWDATAARRLQQKLDAIDGAGAELVRLESETISRLNVAERLKLLESHIIRYARDLLHFDHFSIRVLDPRTQKLELVISHGLPPEASELEIYARAEGNGISGYVAATGRSYICPDVERDRRYMTGLHGARSSLTVPLFLHDKVIGVFNIESHHRAAFNEDDRQFAEIFGRYVAVALSILNLLVTERANVLHKVADDVCADAAGPLNDIVSDASRLAEEYLGNEEMHQTLRQIAENAGRVLGLLRQTAAGPHAVLGADTVRAEDDPAIRGRRILVADDDAIIRATISDILRKFRAVVTVVTCGSEAIDLLRRQEFDLVLSDIRMPDKTGYEVYAAARRAAPPVPVILMTGFGYDPHHSIKRASEEGLEGVLYKPFKVQQLLQTVRKSLAALKPAADTAPVDPTGGAP